MLTTKDYHIPTWKETFHGEVDFDKLYLEGSWKKIIQPLKDQGGFKPLEKLLTEEIKEHDIFPYPNLLFNAFNLTPFDTVKVVFIGQDPYQNAENIDGKMIPFAMGQSFSVPAGIKIPSSLENILRNQLKYNHIFKMPPHGNLFSWASQGCLMLNTALTVRKNDSNSHSKYWQWFTNEIITKISKNKEHVVFVLWGLNALSKLPLIDLDKHEVIISSHPSGYSVDKPMRDYPPFNDVDHFGKINQYLQNFGERKIFWMYC